MKATKADIVCFTTSQQISNIGDQMQALMIYDNPVMALEDLGQTVSCPKYKKLVAMTYLTHFTCSLLRLVCYIHLPHTKQTSSTTTFLPWVSYICRGRRRWQRIPATSVQQVLYGLMC
jgi:hypothetical protein